MVAIKMVTNAAELNTPYSHASVETISEISPNCSKLGLQFHEALPNQLAGEESGGGGKWEAV